MIAVVLIEIIEENHWTAGSNWQTCQETPMSEWLLFNAKWVIFQLYHGKNKFDIWWNDDDRFVQDQHA